MKTTLKLLVLAALALFFTACAPSGGSDSGSSGGSSPTETQPLVDNTPHNYTATLYMPGGQAAFTHTATIKQVCNFGFAGSRDDTSNFTFSGVNDRGGAGCNNAKNISYRIENTGSYTLFLVIEKDGVRQHSNPDYEELSPGEVYTYTRGF